MSISFQRVPVFFCISFSVIFSHFKVRILHDGFCRISGFDFTFDGVSLASQVALMPGILGGGFGILGSPLISPPVTPGMLAGGFGIRLSPPDSPSTPGIFGGGSGIPELSSATMTPGRFGGGIGYT